MSNFRINLRKAITGCATNPAYFEQFSTEELHRRLRHYQKQGVIMSVIWVALMVTIFFVTGQKEDVLSMFIISGGTTIWLSYEDFKRRKAAIQQVLNSRQ